MQAYQDSLNSRSLRNFLKSSIELGDGWSAFSPLIRCYALFFGVALEVENEVNDGRCLVLVFIPVDGLKVLT